MVSSELGTQNVLPQTLADGEGMIVVREAFGGLVGKWFDGESLLKA
jgi:hypothetical protein